MNSGKQFKLIQTDNYKPGIFKVPGLRSVCVNLQSNKIIYRMLINQIPF